MGLCPSVRVRVKLLEVSVCPGLCLGGAALGVLPSVRAVKCPHVPLSPSPFASPCAHVRDHTYRCVTPHLLSSPPRSPVSPFPSHVPPHRVPTSPPPPRVQNCALCACAGGSGRGEAAHAQNGRAGRAEPAHAQIRRAGRGPSGEACACAVKRRCGGSAAHAQCCGCSAAHAQRRGGGTAHAQ